MSRRLRKKNKRSSTVKNGETATPERRRQLGGVETEIVDRDASGKVYIKRQRARLECMLDYYLKLRRISEEQYKAGCKFRYLYLRAAHNYSCLNLTDRFRMEPKQADPEWRLLNHMDCIRVLIVASKELTPEEYAIVRNVCGYDSFAGNRENKRILDHALGLLATHWGYI
jgi:hypothetical protein